MLSLSPSFSFSECPFSPHPSATPNSPPLSLCCWCHPIRRRTLHGSFGPPSRGRGAWAGGWERGRGRGGPDIPAATPVSCQVSTLARPAAPRLATLCQTPTPHPHPRSCLDQLSASSSGYFLSLPDLAFSPIVNSIISPAMIRPAFPTLSAPPSNPSLSVTAPSLPATTAVVLTLRPRRRPEALRGCDRRASCSSSPPTAQTTTARPK